MVKLTLTSTYKLWLRKYLPGYRILGLATALRLWSQRKKV